MAPHISIPSLSRLNQKFVDLATGYEIPKVIQIKILLIIAHTFFLIWACISSFMYVGCLDSELLCPISQFRIPFTRVAFSIPSELPLYILVVILVTVNITHIVYAERVRKINIYLLAAAAALFLFSNIFIETRVRLEDALIEELRKLGIQ